MRIPRSLLVVCLIGGTASLASAESNSYVCKIRVETGFSKLTDTGLPQSTQMRVSALLMSQPYCQGQSAGNINLSTPLLEPVRKRKQVITHMTKVYSAWQAITTTYQVLAIAASQGAPLHRGQEIAVNVEEQPPRDFAFQATRVASTAVKAKDLPTGVAAGRMSGYVCFARSSFRLTDPTMMVTVADIQNFEVRLHSEPFCLGKQIASQTYEFGPPMRLPRRTHEQSFKVTANMSASTLMHAVHATLLSAASSGQHVTLDHNEQGLLSAIEIMARPRDLNKELKTIATPGQ